MSQFFAISQDRKAYCCYKSQNRFLAGNVGKLSAMLWELVFRYKFFAAGAPCVGEATYFSWSRWNMFFLQFREQAPFKLKNKISAVQCDKKTCSLRLILTPVISRWAKPFICKYQSPYYIIYCRLINFIYIRFNSSSWVFLYIYIYIYIWFTTLT